MRIALISDIHGNMPAFEAVLNDIEERKADSIICLGDIVGKGPSPKEAIDLCRKKCDTILKGNWEDGLYKDYVNLNKGMLDEIGVRTRWNLNSIGAQRMEYLGSLPHSTEFYLSGKLIRAFHAHPLNFNRYYQSSPIEQRLELFGYGEEAVIRMSADVAIYADIHSAYMQILKGKHLLNTGSVGNPLDMCQASYVVLEGEMNSRSESSFSIQFVRVLYDIDKAVEIAKEYNVPDLEGYISELTTATYFRRA